VTAFSGATVFAAEDVPSAGGDEVSPSRDDWKEGDEVSPSVAVAPDLCNEDWKSGDEAGDNFVFHN
jgi:hypothetical protein